MPFAIVGFFLGLHKINFDIHQIHFTPLLFNIFKTNIEFNGLALLLLVILCMIFARSAAMGFNRYADATIDKLNPRTSLREIPKGIIQKKYALWFVCINCLLFIINTLFINKACFYLSPVALFIILFYSYTKRFTPLCHLVLGIGLSLAPIGAYLAITAQFHLLPILFSLLVFTWVTGFDILYSLQDEKFDRAHNLKSIPVLIGIKNAMNISKMFHLITAVTAIYIGIFYFKEIFYFIGALLFICLLIYQHFLVKPNDFSKINIAFANTNGIGSVIFAIFIIISLFNIKNNIF